MLDHTQEFGKIVRNRRIELGLTQNQVAEQIDVDVRTVLNIENHKGNPKMEVLFPLIRALKIDANSIFYPELSENQSSTFQFQVLLSQCSEHELQALLAVCQTVIQVWHSNGTMFIDDHE